MCETQINEILNHLKEFGVITSYTATLDYGCTRLSSVILRLRQRGHNIKTVMTDGKTRGERSCRYAVYHYISEKK